MEYRDQCEPIYTQRRRCLAQGAIHEVGPINLTLSRRGDYVVRAALALARTAPAARYQKIREVAQEMAIPRSFTPQVLGLLQKAGLAEARAGRDGGYRLTRRPAEISLLEVVEAGEGPLRNDRCTLRGGPCHWEQACALHPAWSTATEALRASLRDTTLQDVADVDRGLENRTFEVPADSHRRIGQP